MMNKKSPSFTERILRVVKKISKGSVLTYSDVACRAGAGGAYRAVGNILSKNFDPDIPCHRVVRSDGSLGGYNRGARKKKVLLKQEGVLY